jgi:HD domain-containing protein
MGAMRSSSTEAKPQLRVADSLPVGRPGRSLALGIAAVVGAVPSLAIFAPRSAWGSGILVAALGAVALFSYFGAILLSRSVAIDAASVAAIAALVFLGPVPAACIWVGTELVALCVERIRPTAFFANVASYAWGSVAGGLVLSFTAGSAPLSETGIDGATAAAVGLAGLVMLSVNYLVTRTLTVVVGDGRSFVRTIRSEFVPASAVVLAMAAMATATVLLYGEVGILALGLFALAVQVPQLVIPALMRPRPVSELDHTGAVSLYALAIADVLDLGYRKCQVLKDAAQFMRERPMVPRDGHLSNLSAEHRLALVEAVLYYREHWDGEGGKPGAFGGDLIPLSSRILAVADAWAGLTSKNSPQLSHAQAMHQLEARAGMHFDPAIVAAASQVVADEHLGLPARIAYQPKIHRLPLPRAAGRALSAASS